MIDSMETALSRQLQQAWLHTQMRKQQQLQQQSPSPLSLETTPSLPLETTPLPADSSSFSSSSASDDSLASFPSYPPAHHELDLDEEAFGDPVLHYISDMLLEKDMEDRKCMMQECSSYHATVKSFYEALGEVNIPSAAYDVSEALENPDNNVTTCSYPDFEDEFGTVFDSVDLKAFSDAEPDLSVHGSDASVDASENAYDWMDELLKDMGYVLPEKKDTAPSRHSVAKELSTHWSSDSPGTVLLSPQPSPDSSLQAGNHSPSEGDLLHNWLHIESVTTDERNVLNDTSADSLSMNSPFHTDGKKIKESGQYVCNGSKDALPVVLYGNPIPNVVVKPVEKLMQSADFGRPKRAATEVETAVEGLKLSRNHSTLLPTKGNYDKVDSKTEEIVSYVQNANLNAEICGEVLKHGLSIMASKLRGLSLGPKEDNPGTKQQRLIPFTADLRSLLINCAQAVAAEDIGRAHKILQEIRKYSSPYGNGIQRLAHYFAEGLVARLSRTGGRLYTAFTNNAPSAAKMLKSYHLFVEVCPFVKVSHYFANKAILEAAKGASKIHIIDYGILYGLQWPCLISALAEQKGSLSQLRITGIDFPQPGVKATERVEMTGRRLAEYAKAYGVPFEYHAIADKWENIHPSSLRLKQDEVLIVNSIFRLRHLLDETVLASNPRKTLLNRIRSLNPKIFIEGVKNGSFNTPFFMSRFKESLNYYSYEFDMMDATISLENQERMVIEREVLGRDILNVVACEGPERIERAETYQQWQNRTSRAGFKQMPLEQNTMREAQTIVKRIYDENFSVDEEGHWVLLRWKGQALYALSQWKPA